MLTISVRLEGVVNTKAMLKRVKKILTDMEPGMTEAGKYLLKVFSVEAFESEGGIYGKRWPMLNPAYALKKSQEYPGRGILEKTGKLRKGFKLSTGATYALIRNDVEYGVYHQSTEPRTVIPRRVIVSLEKRQRDEVQRILREYILGRLRRAV